MAKSDFLTSLQKKIDKFDIRTLKDFLYNVIEDLNSLKTVFNSMAEGVLVVGMDKNIIFLNKVASKLLDIPINSINLESNEELTKMMIKMIKEAEKVEYKKSNLINSFITYFYCMNFRKELIIEYKNIIKNIKKEN